MTNTLSFVGQLFNLIVKVFRRIFKKIVILMQLYKNAKKKNKNMFKKYCYMLLY